MSHIIKVVLIENIYRRYLLYTNLAVVLLNHNNIESSKLYAKTAKHYYNLYSWSIMWLFK